MKMKMKAFQETGTKEIVSRILPLLSVHRMGGIQDSPVAVGFFSILLRRYVICLFPSIFKQFPLT